MTRTVLGILVAAVAFCAPARLATADAKAGTPDRLLVRITADEVQGEALQRSRGLISLLIAHYSRVPGLALLEGDPVAQQKRQDEIALSGKGLVDEDTRIADRTMKADVTITLRGLTYDAATKRTALRILAEGPLGRREAALTFLAIDGLGFDVNEVVRHVVGPAWVPAFQGDCVEGDPQITSLTRVSCAAAIARACVAAHAVARDRLSCMARRGQEIHRWAKQAGKHADVHVPITAEEQAATERLRQGGKGTEADMVLYTAFGQRMAAFVKDLEQAMESFRPALVEAMERLINEGPIDLYVGDGTPLRSITVVGARWKRLDYGPMVMFDLKADSESRRVTRTVGGREVDVIEDVRSFGLRGLGDAGGTVFEYRLLCSGLGPADCNVQTSLRADYFDQTRSVRWYEPEWRVRR